MPSSAASSSFPLNRVSIQFLSVFTLRGLVAPAAASALRMSSVVGAAAPLAGVRFFAAALPAARGMAGSAS